MHKAGIMKGELVFDRRRDLLLNTLDVGSPGWAPIIGVSANVRAGQVAKVSRLASVCDICTFELISLSIPR